MLPYDQRVLVDTLYPYSECQVMACALHRPKYLEGLDYHYSHCSSSQSLEELLLKLDWSIDCSQNLAQSLSGTFR